MRLLLEVIKIKNNAKDKGLGYLQCYGMQNKELCDPKFSVKWEKYAYNDVIEILKLINAEVEAIQNRPLTAESQEKTFNKIMELLDEFDKVYGEYNSLMEYHKHVFETVIFKIIAEERRTEYNFLKKNKNNIIANLEVVLSKYINIVKNKPMINLDMADIVISKMEESFQLEVERELYVDTEIKHRKHSHRPSTSTSVN